MKLAILCITSGGMSGGYGKYLQELLPLFSKSEKISKILLALPESFGTNFLGGISDKIEFLRLVPGSFKRFGLSDKTRKVILDFSPDLIFIPSAKYFKIKKIPVVNMVRNMEPLAFITLKGSFTDYLKTLARYYETYIAVKKSDRIIAVSGFVRDFLTKKFKLDEKKIGTVYHGISRLTYDSVKRPETLSETIRRNFIFTAGSIRPARGLFDLLKALVVLKNRYRQNPTTVIAGSADKENKTYLHKLKNFLDEQNISDSVIFTGNLSQPEMNWCYANCRLFVMTSRVEACPNIALEAMSYGTLTVAANNPPLPEFFRTSAHYYRPKNYPELAFRISRFLNDDKNGFKALRAEAKRISLEFTWEKCVENTLKEFTIL